MLAAVVPEATAEPLTSNCSVLALPTASSSNVTGPLHPKFTLK